LLPFTDSHTSGIISERAAEDLFQVDAAPSDTIQKKVLQGKKPLKSEEILAQRSAVPAVPSRKRKNENTTDGVLPVKRKTTDYVSRKQLEKLRDIAFRGDAVVKDVVDTSNDATYDPWDDQARQRQEKYSFLEEKKPIKAPQTLKDKPIALVEGDAEVKAVKVPEAGRSYNPDVNDWMAVLAREEAKEAELEARRQEEARREAELQELIEKAAAEQEEEDNGSEWESEWEGFTDREDESVTQKRPERKTHQERNRIKKRKLEEARRQGEEKAKIRKQQLAQLVQIRREIDSKEPKRRKALTKSSEGSSDEEHDERLKRRRPFGKTPLKQAPLDVLLSEDLTESLRQLKPQGSIMNDRFRSLLLRGKVESRKAMQHKKPMRTVTEKWSYKDFELKY